MIPKDEYDVSECEAFIDVLLRSHADPSVRNAQNTLASDIIALKIADADRFNLHDRSLLDRLQSSMPH